MSYRTHPSLRAYIRGDRLSPSRMGWLRRVCAVVVCVLLVAQPSWGGAKHLNNGAAPARYSKAGGPRDNLIKQIFQRGHGHSVDKQEPPKNMYELTESNIQGSQLMVMESTVAKVAESLEMLYPDLGSLLTIIALRVATSWGNMQSLDELAIRLRLENAVAITNAQGAGLGDIMYYLFHMKCKEDDAFAFINIVVDDPIETSYVPGQGEVILLDTITLRRLETVPAFREHVASNLDKFVFAVPYAWTGGFHMFKSARTFAQYAIDYAGEFWEAYQSDDCENVGAKRIDCALDKIFKYPVLGRLQALLPELKEDNVIWLKRYKYHGSRNNDKLKAVYRNLRPSLPNANDLKRFAEQVRPCVEEGSSAFEKDRSVMNFISNYQNINTMPALLETAWAMVGKISSSGFDFQKVIIPAPGKSTGIVVHALFSLLEGDPRVDASMIQYFPLNTDNVRRGAGEDMKRLLIVDDLALSGDQVKEWAVKFGRLKGVEEVRVGALYVSPVAVEAFKLAGVDALIGKALPLPPPAERWMVKSGYKGGREAFATQYMAPDNNFQTFRQLLAPKVTFHGKGVKWYRDSWTVPDCSKWTEEENAENMRGLMAWEREYSPSAQGV